MMRSKSLRMLRVVAALGLLTLFVLADFSRAQSPGPSSGDLETRLKVLEEQNLKLQKQLEELLKTTGGTKAPDPVPIRVDVAPTPVETIVGDILRKKEAEKKAEEEHQKKVAESEGTVVGSDLSMKIKWDNGFWAETADKAFRFHIGGRTQFDTVWVDAPFNVQYEKGGTGRADDAVAFRRGRFAMEGSLWEVFQFNMEYDFVNSANDTPANSIGPALQTISTPAPTDLWIQIDQVPIVGHVRMGNLKPPISFEHMTSSRFLNFLERSYMFDFLVGGPDNGFDPGIQIFDTLFDKRMYWSASITKNNQSIFGFNVGDGEAAYTFRLTGLPVWQQEGRVAVHTGIGYQVRQLNDLVQRVRARMQIRNGPAALHTPLFDFNVAGDLMHLLVPEFVVIAGPWTIQSEFYGTWITNARNTPNEKPVGTAFYPGYYAEVLYMLTGEHRAYDRDTPRLGRVTPYENFFLVPDENGGKQYGTGAWQVGLRYEYIDLASLGLGLNRGTAHGLTAGLNWFLNPNMKIQFNYSWEHRQNQANPVSSGDISAFGIRVASDW